MIKSLILTSIAFLTLGFGNVTAPVQDRCAELDATGYPSYCQPAGPDAAWWDDELCCAGAQCVETTTAGCPKGKGKYWCDHVEIDSEGIITCLFKVPAYCDTHDCSAPAPGYQPQPESNVMCCYAEGCYDPMGASCGGILYWCDDGVSNANGTVTCFDPDTPETN